MTYNTKQFLIDKDKQSMSAEVSTLHAGNKKAWLFEIFERNSKTEEATVVGFYLQSSKTNLVTRWELEATHRESSSADELGDVTFWRMRPSALTIQDVPQLNGWEIIIFND